MLRYAEQTTGGRVIHANSAEGYDTTLCGYALEGVASTSDFQEESLIPLTRGKIDCQRCLAIITFCKKIPARLCAPIEPS